MYMAYYTNYPRDDGFGAIFQNIIFDILYTEYHGNKFVYTSTPAIDHNYNNDPNFTYELEKFMNIKESYKLPDNFDKTKLIIYPRASTYTLVESNINSLISTDSFLKIKDEVW